MSDHGTRATLPVRFTDARTVAMVDPSSGCAFGPTFPTEAEASAFLDWLAPHGDPADIHEDKLNDLYRQWKETQQ